MTVFAYRAVDPSGRRVAGHLEAEERLLLERRLERQGLVLLQVEEADEGSSTGGRLRWPGARGREVLEATRSLSALLESGLSLGRSVEITASVVGGGIAPALERIRTGLGRGASVAEAFGGEPRWFAPHYVGVLGAGEGSGDLAGAFARLTEHLEREHELRGRIVSSLVYPGILAAFGGLSVLVILLFVVPRFGDLLVEAGARLPASTAVLVGLSELLRGQWPLFVAGVLGTGTAIAVAFRSDVGRARLGGWALKLPLLGTLHRELLAARFARLVGVLLDGGAPVLTALDGAGSALDSPRARKALALVRDRVREGEPLTRALAAGGLFPDLLVRLVAVGEESGRLADFLHKAAEVFETRVERAVGRLVVLLEPIMIVVFGGVVAVVAFALLQAIYGVNAGVFQ